MVQSGALGGGLRVATSCPGVLADHGTHLIDCIRFVLGEKRAPAALGLGYLPFVGSRARYAGQPPL
jgi:predicted dehydrogenase